MRCSQTSHYRQDIVPCESTKLGEKNEFAGSHTQDKSNTRRMSRTTTPAPMIYLLPTSLHLPCHKTLSQTATTNPTNAKTREINSQETKNTLFNTSNSRQPKSSIYPHCNSLKTLRNPFQIRFDASKSRIPTNYLDPVPIKPIHRRLLSRSPEWHTASSECG
jgi:hypothetical protein